MSLSSFPEPLSDAVVRVLEAQDAQDSEQLDELHALLDAWHDGMLSTAQAVAAIDVLSGRR